MPVLPVVDQQNQPAGEIALDEDLFNGVVKAHLIHEVVVMQLANRRAGTASAKTRSEVSGSGAKPWRQKGTGRARAGDRRSPLWRHGAVIFPPKPRDYSYRPPRKVRRAALLSALNLRLQDGQVKVIDHFDFPQGKCREVTDLLDRLGLKGKVLFVTGGPNERLRRASQNLPGLKSLPAIGLNVLDVMDCGVLLCSRDGLSAVQERLRVKEKVRAEAS
jgi:large subunit ribosomal protein L4